MNSALSESVKCKVVPPALLSLERMIHDLGWFYFCESLTAFYHLSRLMAGAQRNALHPRRTIDRDTLRAHLDAKMALILSTRSGVGWKRLLGGGHGLVSLSRRVGLL